MNLHQHLKDRHLDVSLYSSVIICDDVVVFPLWNLSGQWCGYQQYRPEADKAAKNHPRDGRYYTSLHGSKYEKPIGVWGVDTLHFDPHIVVIVEGVFDACRLHNRGIPAVALLSSSYKSYRNWINSLGRKVYKVEDDHGSSLGPYQNLHLPDGVGDLGECSEQQLTTVINQIKGE